MGKDIQEFNRVEFKYWISEREKWQFFNFLKEFMVEDTHNKGEVGYNINSLYFDTLNLASYYEKYDGDNFRRKFRARFYGDKPEKIYLEIKEKRGMHVRKKRVAKTILSQGTGVDLTGIIQELPQEGDTFLTSLHTLNLRPTCWVSYNRVALRGRHDPSLRITFDHAVSGELAEGFLFPRNRIRPVSLSGWSRPIILEIKFQWYIPTWLKNAIEDLSLMNVPITNTEW